MLEIETSEALADLTSSLDEDWEASLVAGLPFPIAYPLAKLQEEGYPWDRMVAGTLSHILKYLAAVGISDYLHSTSDPDFDLNDALKETARPMSEGKWLSIIRRCVNRSGTCVITEFPDVWADLEEGQYWTKLSAPKILLKTQRQGILSSLVTLRNSLYAHSGAWTLTKQEKEHAGDRIVPLIRAALFLLEPIWRYRVVQTFKSQTLVLKGVSEFGQIQRPNEAGDVPCFLLGKEDSFALPLHPLAFADNQEKHLSPTLLDEGSEMYLFSNLERSRVPIYSGLGGGQSRREELTQLLGKALQDKLVWEKRQDIKLDGVLSHLQTKTGESLASLTESGVIDLTTYAGRPECEQELHDFLTSDTTRSLFLTGRSGSGKTVTSLHLIAERIEKNEPAMLVRALELPDDIVKPGAFERWLTATLGYAGPFRHVLQRCRNDDRGQLLLVVDGLNEFAAAGRDASLLFRAINTFVADHSEEPALKVVLTARDDMLDVFLPGGRLPPDVDDTLYFRPAGCDFVRVGALTAAEAADILRRLAVPADTAESLLQRDATALRNPHILWQIAVGVIDPQDLDDLTEQGITSRFIDRRLGRDRELRKSLMRLVALMATERNETLSEQVLLERAPGLYSQLRAEDGRLLTTLRELGMVQVIAIENQEGKPAWSLAMTHDTLFEALDARQDRSLLIRETAQFLGAVACCCLGLLLVDYSIRFLVDSIITTRSEAWQLQIAVDLADSAGEQNGAAAAQPLAAATAVVQSVRSLGYEALDLYMMALWRFIAATSLPLVLLFMIDSAITVALKRASTSDRRVRFYGRFDEIAFLRRWLKYAWLAVVVAMLWACVGFAISLFSEISPSLPVLVAPLLIFLVYLLLLLPVCALRNLRFRSRWHSPLLRQYYLAPRSIRQGILSRGQLLIKLGIALGWLAFAVSHFPPMLIAEECSALRSRVRERATALDTSALTGDDIPSTEAVVELRSWTRPSFIDEKLDRLLWIAEDPLTDWEDDKRGRWLPAVLGLFWLYVLAVILLDIGLCCRLSSEFSWSETNG